MKDASVDKLKHCLSFNEAIGTGLMICVLLSAHEVGHNRYAIFGFIFLGINHFSIAEVLKSEVGYGEKRLKIFKIVLYVMMVLYVALEWYFEWK